MLFKWLSVAALIKGEMLSESFYSLPLNCSERADSSNESPYAKLSNGVLGSARRALPFVTFWARITILLIISCRITKTGWDFLLKIHTAVKLSEQPRSYSDIHTLRSMEALR